MTNEKELRLVLDALPAAALRCDRDGRYLWVNPLYARWVGQRPEALVGRQVVVVANLQPATLMGVESQGMVLAASVDGAPVLLRPDREVPAGSRVK